MRQILGQVLMICVNKFVCDYYWGPLSFIHRCLQCKSSLPKLRPEVRWWNFGLERINYKCILTILIFNFDLFFRGDNQMLSISTLCALCFQGLTGNMHISNFYMRAYYSYGWGIQMLTIQSAWLMTAPLNGNGFYNHQSKGSGSVYALFLPR